MQAPYPDPNYPVQVNATKHALPATWRGPTTAAATDESTCSLTTNFVGKASIHPPLPPLRARLNYLSHYAEICGVSSSVDSRKSGRNLPKIERRCCCREAMPNNPRNEESSLYANARQDQLHFGTGEGVNFERLRRECAVPLSSIGRSLRCQVYLCISLQKCPPPFFLPPPL